MEGIPEPQKIEEALYLILNTTDEDVRKQASDYLRQLEINQPNLLLSLIYIVENSSIKFSKFQSLILIKNIIVRNWIRATIINRKKVNILTEELKTIVKGRVFNFLLVCKEQKERDAVNSILKAIAKYDFPGKFIELENYFISTLEQYSQQSFETTYLLDFMVTLNEVQKEVVKNNLMAYKIQQYQFTCKILKSFVTIWKRVSYEHSINQQQNIIELSSKMDRLLCYLSMSFHQEDDIQYISEIFTALLEKCAWLLKQQHEQYQIKTIVSSLVNLQQQYPISIGNAFNDYLSLLKFIIVTSWQDQRILKIGLIGFIQILKTYKYYCTNEQFTTTIPQPKTQMFSQLGKEIQQHYYQFFQSNINIFLETLITINDEDQYYKAKEEKLSLQTPLSLLCFQFQEELIKRFPEQVLLYLQFNIKQLISNDFSSINFSILDCFFIQMNQFICLQGNIESQQIPVGSILNYLLTLNTTQSQHRFIQICIKYLPYSTNEEQNIILKQLILFAKNQENPQIQIQAKRAIFEYFDTVENNNLDQQLVILSCQIFISQLLEQAENYHPLFTIVENLLFQLIKRNSNELVFATGLNLLIQQKNQILLEPFCEIIKALFLRFPLGMNQPIIITISLQVIELNVQQQASLILDLSLFFLMEYDEMKDKNVLGICLKNIISKNEEFLLLQKSPLIQKQYLKLIEEFVLLNCHQFDHNFLHSLINQCNKQEILNNQDESSLKEQCLSLLETIVIKNYGQIDASINQQLIMQLVLQLITLEQSSNKSFMCQNCKNIIINIINRFILNDVNNFLKIIISNGVTFDTYFGIWLENTQHLSNKGVKRINTAAQLLTLQHLSAECFTKIVQQTFQECLPDIFYDLELKSQSFRKQERENKIKYFNGITTRKSKNRESLRKEVMLEQYDESIDLKNLFFQALQVFKILYFIQKSMLTFNMREIIHDSKILNSMNMLLDEC